MIIVGAGAGVAPFIGFLQERACLKSQDYSISPSLLFFGCRFHAQDFYYRSELERYTEAGILEHKDRVWELLQDGGVIYVCRRRVTSAKSDRSS